MALDEDADLHSTVYTVSKTFKPPKVRMVVTYFSKFFKSKSFRLYTTSCKG